MSGSTRHWIIRLLAIVLASGVEGLYNHYAYSRQHRIYYDEDVYADISGNIATGLGAGVTVSWLPGAATTENSKWPLGFPVLALPWVSVFGPERGPFLWNEVCGVLTGALIGVLVMRRTRSLAAGVGASLLFLFNPVTAGWYRSGSSDPSALLLALAAMVMATERSGAAPGLLVAFLAALNIRLDNLALLFPLGYCLLQQLAGRAAEQKQLKGRAGGWKHRTIFVVISLLLTGALAFPVRAFRSHYLTGRPESSFSLSFAGPNLWANLCFVKEIGMAPLAFAGLACLIWLSARQRTWRPFLIWITAQMAILSVYSVGRYSSPGGSRFLMIPFAVFSAAILTSAVILAQRFRVAGIAAALVLWGVCFPGRDQTQSRLNAANIAPQMEHAAILRWARRLPRGAIVMSSTPYLWKAAGVFSCPPHSEVEVRTGGPLFWHRGLFDRDQPIASGLQIVENDPTPFGDVTLFRLR